MTRDVACRRQRPRQVTQLLRDLGHDAVEVRDVPAASAPDAAIAALARRSDRRVVTHDVRFARACRRDGIPDLWVRMPEATTRDGSARRSRRSRHASMAERSA
ncbi:MAG: DUF5615 family PIN-like protein [Candidatus Limnocylindrales bacterium]